MFKNKAHPVTSANGHSATAYQLLDTFAFEYAIEFSASKHVNQT